MKACLGGLAIAERRLHALIERYGLDTVDRGIEAVLEWCRQGPPCAQVERVEVVEEEPEGLSGFTIA